MNKETGANIYSSTGRLGTTLRPFDRIYNNSKIPYSDPGEFEARLGNITRIVEKCPKEITRSVFRAIVSEDVLLYIINNGRLHSHLEVALPLEEFTKDNSWLIYMAKNKPGREEIIPREAMIRQTDVYVGEITSPPERVKAITEKGYSFVNKFSGEQVNQIHSLWGKTFGWQFHEVDNLRKRLISGEDKPPSEKDLWFSAIKYNDTIISAAMAEKLSMPSMSGNLDLVESTEWKTGENYIRNGFMAATLAALNAQVLSDLKYSSNGHPLIIAECNFQSRSDRAGHGAGFRIPERNVAPQILVQNVGVNDGYDVGQGKLRDFTFVYLPGEMIKNHYNPAHVNSIMQMIKS